MKEAGIKYGIPLREWSMPTAGKGSCRGLHGYVPGRPPQGGGFELRPKGCIVESSGRRWRKSVLGGDAACAKVLRWAKCGMFEGKRVEREGQSDKTGARADQQAPLDQGEELRFYLTDHVKPWKALGGGLG